MVILLFGQPASGKTTLSDLLVPIIGNYAIRIDGDVWRDITQNKDYSREGRINNLKSACNVAILLEMQGYVPIMSFVTPYSEIRDYLSDKTGLIQVYLTYEGDRGRNGFFAQDFELPNNDCLHIDTSIYTKDESILKILDYIKKNKGYELE